MRQEAASWKPASWVREHTSRQTASKLSFSRADQAQVRFQCDRIYSFRLAALLELNCRSNDLVKVISAAAPEGTAGRMDSQSEALRVAANETPKASSDEQAGNKKKKKRRKKKKTTTTTTTTAQKKSREEEKRESPLTPGCSERGRPLETPQGTDTVILSASK